MPNLNGVFKFEKELAAHHQHMAEWRIYIEAGTFDIMIPYNWEIGSRRSQADQIVWSDQLLKSQR